MRKFCNLLVCVIVFTASLAFTQARIKPGKRISVATQSGASKGSTASTGALQTSERLSNAQTSLGRAVGRALGKTTQRQGTPDFVNNKNKVPGTQPQ
jgi:hypothetical protein